MVFWVLARGLERKIGFMMCLFSELGLLAYTVFLGVFSQISSKLGADQRVTAGNIVIIIMIFYLVILLIWQMARAYVDFTIIWRRFKMTDFYFEYIETEEERLKRWEK